MSDPFAYIVTVQFEDVDSFRIAHHTRLIAYLERARVRLFAQWGVDLSASDFFILLHDLQMTFCAPARLLDELTIKTSVRSIDELRLVLEYTIHTDKRLIAKATAVLVCTDAETGGIIPVPLSVKTHAQRMV